MGLAEKISNWLGLQQKEPLAAGGGWLGPLGWSPAFGETDQNVRTMIEEGYKKNSAVFACISTLAFAFPEPPLAVFSRSRPGEVISGHPIRLLLNQPNPLMGEAELLQYVITYMALGGNTYLFKFRGQGDRVTELWPYHAGEMWPVASDREWISHYVYDRGDGTLREVAKRDVIHLKWMPDPQAPGRGMPPLKAVARETDSDNELTRYLYALLRNDAMPRTALRLPETAHLSEEQYRRLKEQFQMRYGGDRRGQVAVLEGGVEIERLALDLEQLAFDTLRGVPEARIAAAFRVPPIVAGLSVGRNHSTYANYREARRSFAEQTLVPLWRSVAGEIEQGLRDDFAAGDVEIRFDLRRVEALAESESDRWRRVLDGVERGVLRVNEARVQLGYEPVADGEHFA